MGGREGRAEEAQVVAVVGHVVVAVAADVVAGEAAVDFAGSIRRSRMDRLLIQGPMDC